MDKEEIKEEIIRCGRDPCYFIYNYVKIKHPTRGLIPFHTYDYQEELVGDYIKNRFNIVLKARQLGISEITAAYAAWLMLFRRDKSVLVIATKSDTAKNMVRKVATALKKLPKWLMLADISTDNKLSIELSNGSSCKAVASSSDAGRSEALSLLIIDEAAFITNLDALWTGLFPTVQAGGRVIVISTPNGVGNKYHQLYTESESGLNEFKSTKLMWWVHPERMVDLSDDPDRPGFKTSPWYRNEIKSSNMSPRDVAQELDCNFNASGETILTNDALEWIAETVYQPIRRESVDNALYVWFDPEAESKYMITADVARGDGRDNSAFHVLKIATMEQVAEFCSKLQPDKFAEVLCDVGRKYNKALLIVENNNVGFSCLKHIELLGYENVFYSFKGIDRTHKDGPIGEAVHAQWGPSRSELIPGFTTSQRTRPLIVNKLEEYTRKKEMTIRGQRTLEELRTFIWNNSRAEAMRGYNDDLTISLAIAVWMRDNFFMNMFATSDVQKSMISSISLNRTQNDQIQGASKDPQVARFQSILGRQLGPPMEIRLPNGQVADFSWLLPISKG